MAKQGRKTDDQLLRNRRIASMKTLYFNRFILARYSLAIFFFSNFLLAYLCFPEIAGIGAVGMLIMAILPIWEMGKMYGEVAPKYKMTKYFFVLQWFFNLILIFMTALQPVSQTFPFLTDISTSRIVMLVVLVIGLALVTFVLYRFYQIDRNVDKAYRRIEFFEKKYRMHI